MLIVLCGQISLANAGFNKDKFLDDLIFNIHHILCIPKKKIGCKAFLRCILMKEPFSHRAFHLTNVLQIF